MRVHKFYPSAPTLKAECKARTPLRDCPSHGDHCVSNAIPLMPDGAMSVNFLLSACSPGLPSIIPSSFPTPLVEFSIYQVSLIKKLGEPEGNFCCDVGYASPGNRRIERSMWDSRLSKLKRVTPLFIGPHERPPPLFSSMVSTDYLFLLGRIN
jgi:hypothetical protein